MQSCRMLLLMLVLLACMCTSVAAGCAGEIFNCNNDRNPCGTTQCGQGLVCRVDNCNGCVAKCERPGTVHIMSLPSAGGPQMGGSGRPPVPNSNTATNGAGSRPLNSNSNKVTTEASCPCPRSFMPVCGSDGKKYNNKCLAECAGATATAQQPDSNGNCPKAAAAPGATGTSSSSSSGNTKAPEAKPQQQQAQATPATPPAPRPLPFTCRCAQSNTPVCGKDGKYYESECFAICEGVEASSVQPDRSKKTCTMGSGGANSASNSGSSAVPRNMLRQGTAAATPTKAAGA